MRSVLITLVCGAMLAAPGGAAAAGDPLRSQQYGLDLIESDAAHATATGRGRDHRDHRHRSARVAPRPPGRPPAPGPGLRRAGDDTPQDAVDGHGTHVLGIAGATEGNGVGISSVAPGATHASGAGARRRRSGDIRTSCEGIDYAIAQGADVINLSLGAACPWWARTRSSTRPSTGRSTRAGWSWRPRATTAYRPARSPRAAAACCAWARWTSAACAASSRTSRGALGVSAPGGSALPCRARTSSRPSTNGDYTEMAGTSQATPHVAGVAALLVEKGLRGQAAVRQHTRHGQRRRHAGARRGVRRRNRERRAGGGRARARRGRRDRAPGSAARRPSARLAAHPRACCGAASGSAAARRAPGAARRLAPRQAPGRCGGSKRPAGRPPWWRWPGSTGAAAGSAPRPAPRRAVTLRVRVTLPGVAAQLRRLRLRP